MMLNKRSETLDHILSIGRPPNMNWDLGYKGDSPKDQSNYVDVINFVQGTISHLKNSLKVEKRHTYTL